MSGTTPTRRAEELRRQINHHDHRYYVLQEPGISDEEYDWMMRELAKLEREHPEVQDPNSPTQRVGGAVSAGFREIAHPEPMLSLGNCTSQQEMADWYERTVRRLGYLDFPMLAEPKIDGLAIRLVYRHGKLHEAITRGNGEVGEDVTHNVKTARNLPLEIHPLPGESLPETLEVRGEIYMPKGIFDEANRERNEQGEQPFANPRNAAAGAVRQLDPALAARRGLRAWVYQNQSGLGNSHEMLLRDLASLHLPVNPLNRLCWNLEEVQSYYREMEERRDELDYEIDGIVVKLDHRDNRELLGATHREPRWAIAWKFASGRAETTLREIRISHGRFGRLTPVAVLDQVELGGVTVQSASLHNEEDIHRKDIRPGTRVVVERAGDVIPQVVRAADPKENERQERFYMPRECPTCGSPVETREGEVGHWCPNLDCPALLPEQLKSFVGKRAMEIDGLGEHWCQELVERKLVQNAGDLYLVTRQEWLGLNRMGEKLADRILRNIEASKSRPLERVLYALGIFRLGRDVSEKLARNHGSIEEISRLSREELESMEGIGPEIAGSIMRGFRSVRVQTTIERMKEAGVNMREKAKAGEKAETAITNGGRKLEGMTIVVTGKLEGMTRNDVEDTIREFGGRPSNTVTKGTSYLVVGEKPGSKLTKANQLGVKVMTQDEFMESLQNQLGGAT